MEKLIAIPIWEQQRIYRPERAQLLAQDIKAKLQDGKPLTLPGVSTARALLEREERVGCMACEPPTYHSIVHSNAR